MVIVKAIDDEPDGHAGLIQHRVSSDGDPVYDGLAVSAVEVVIEDNDGVGLESSGADNLQVSEGGGSVIYSLRLQSRPAGDVTVSLSGGGQLTVEPASLTFTAENWQQSQAVSVKAVDDAMDEGDQHIGLVSYSLSGDPAYAGLPVSEQLVTIADDDVAGVSLSTTAVQVTRSDVAGYEVSLQSQPTEAVLVELQPSGGVRLDMPACDGSEAGACLFFTAENWDQPQAVSVRASALGQVAHEVISGDSGYDGLETPTVSVIVMDGGINIFLPLINK